MNHLTYKNTCVINVRIYSEEAVEIVHLYDIINPNI